MRIQREFKELQYYQLVETAYLGIVNHRTRRVEEKQSFESSKLMNIKPKLIVCERNAVLTLESKSSILFLYFSLVSFLITQVIPPGATAGFDVIFCSSIPQTFYSTISYTINGLHTYIGNKRQILYYIIFDHNISVLISILLCFSIYPYLISNCNGRGSSDNLRRIERIASL